MSRKKTTSIEDLLGKREVQETTSDLSDELLQRREYAPRICSVFSMPYTVLEETDDFDFFVD
ncbi:MAG: hypothetical protein JRD47_11710, partial [Deltaproteobacteria bacterium]|nr:hypothetical protein [Deltaproteobacteria bacterium]